MDSRARKTALPDRIGRYAITGLIGKGGQGVVLGAHDHELDRRVAIKLLRPRPAPADRTLLSEARIVSRLQHPNIVTAHDIGMFRGMHYLVFEYIDGSSLKARIQRGAVPFAESVVLMSQILAGVAYLHENDVIHRDLSPGNILITREGIPKVTDFGISVLKQVQQSPDEVSGTLRYMSPEPFTRQPAGPPSDVFTLSTIFFEMLTGRRRFDDRSPSAIIEAISNGPPIDLAEVGLAVDPKIAQVLAIASARPVAARYPDARAMKNDLDQYRLPRASAGRDAAGHGTVEFLMRRMTYKSGFSALSQHVSELLELTAEDSLAPASRLINTIAKDITLTQRVLTMANSAFYGSTEISALSAAVSMLGLEQVRMCVTSALLENEFEFGSLALRDALLKSFHSAIIAKALAPACRVRNRADAFTCGLFHDLGRTLTIHYFTEEFDAIRERALRLHSDELTESRQILGVPYHELGAGVATQWKFSRAIVEAMRPLPRGRAPRPDSDAACLQLCAAYANAVSRAFIEHDDPARRDVAVAGIDQRIGGAAELTPADFAGALAEGGELTARYARLLKIDPQTSDCARRLLATPTPADQA